MISRNIPIVLCFDRNYADFAAVASYSAKLNSSSDLSFYWICDENSYDHADFLKSELKYLGLNISVVSTETSKVSSWKTSHHFTSASYLRLVSPEIIPDEDRVIYLDCDTLVLTDLAELYRTELSGASFAGVVDHGGAASSEVPRMIGDHYINAGVLLMDTRQLRADNFFEKCKTIYHEYADKITWLDQCIINKYSEGNKVFLDEKWNRQILSAETSELSFLNLANPRISSVLHFVGSIKPWQSWCNPAISRLWWEYARSSNIRNLSPVPINNLNNLMNYANALHMNGSFEEASNFKSKAINILINNLKNK